jgi:tetratricopeptide (TPR) repeat protein
VSVRTRRSTGWFALACTLAACCVGSLVTPLAASAQQSAVAMREKVYEKLSQAQTAGEASDFAGAYGALQEVEKMKNLEPYELAQLYTAYGYIQFLEEKYDLATQSYEKVLVQEKLPEAMRTTTLYTIAQLEFQKEDYAKALRYLDDWLALVKSPGAEPFVLRAQALYQLGRFQEGVESVNRALGIAGERDQEPRENWYLLLRVLYSELKDTKKTTEVLETLVTKFPKKEYWIQLAAMYGELGKEQRGLAAFQIAYDQGFLTSENEIVLLAQLLLQAEVPHRAGSVLAKGMADEIVQPTADNYRLLSQAWMLARDDESAIESLQKAAALTNDGELDARLAQSYLNLDEWDKAVQSAREAIKKGVGDAYQVPLLEGTALYELQRFDDAKAAFRKAGEFPEGSQTAAQWITFIEREEARLAQLQESLP